MEETANQNPAPGYFARALAALLLPLLGIFALATAAQAGQAHLTRFGPQTYASPSGDMATYSSTFRALEGSGSIVLQRSGISEAQIMLNGTAVGDAVDYSQDGKVIVPVTLAGENTITVSVLAEQGGNLGVRVNQFTTADIGVRALMYFGINTSDMDRQRAFYNTLGLTGEIFPAGPEECRTFAQSLGFDDNYRIFVALTSLTGAPPWIDTVEFRDRSLRDDPPYARLNHIGMAYATYSTTDIYGDYELLSELGVEFVSEPAVDFNGDRFVFFKDPDGTYIKLVDEEGESTDGPDIARLINTNMNVSDLQRSTQFYQLLGFTERKNESREGTGPFAEAHGFSSDEMIAFRGIDLSLPGTDAPLPFGGDPLATLQLRQWQTPYDGAPPYWPPVNHLGIDRIAFYVDDLNASIREMNRLGFEQIGPIGGGASTGSIGIVFFYDPDGIKVELWGPVSEPNPNSAC